MWMYREVEWRGGKETYKIEQEAEQQLLFPPLLFCR